MSNKKIKVIITGATGMVGEGVLQECLNNPMVSDVLVVNRKPSGVVHPKLVEVIHADFFNLSSIEGHLYGYNACFFCLGVTSVGLKEPEYFKYTHTLTLNFARLMDKLNHDFTFCYVSGSGTDSSEAGSRMWARVKGKTENDLMQIPFKQEYNFRPGIMKPAPGAKNVLPLYKYIGWLYPLVHTLFPKSACTIAEVGQAMVNVTLNGYYTKILEVEDIVEVAKG